MFQEVINNKPALSTLAFDANFNIKTKNGPEGILVSQSIINPDGSGDNGNVGICWADCTADLLTAAAFSAYGRPGKLF
ncbi:hypothetical protein LWM68_46580 [Niabella sp. W65]|nr:hypothetical protein [Niabella sp. W65]MCH7369542.1 hypothetical protein [Niabella sp. W65]ULT45083.1 hypothetical protein KRR40_18350 [Niabella sp. I65]